MPPAKKRARSAPRAGGAKRATRGKPAAKPNPAGAAGGAGGARAVRAYLAQLPPEHRAIGERLDELIAKQVPGVQRALKWSVPFWGVEGRGWFVSFASFSKYAKVNFLRGSELEPAPPEGSGKQMRAINIARLGDLDEAQMRAWIRQAAAIPGWGA